MRITNKIKNKIKYQYKLEDSSDVIENEEYVGEIDSGGTDLNVTFSIVGENPDDNLVQQLKVSQEVISNLAQQALLQAQKRISGALNSSVGLL